MIPPSEYFSDISNAQHRSIPFPKSGWTILCAVKQNQLFQVFSRENPLLIYTPTCQVSLWLAALTCDRLCPLSQSCVKLSICASAQNCTTDSAVPQQAPHPPGLNALPPIAQLHWKQGIFYSNN